ncbi:MAG: hypothetical protein WEC82_02275 [Xanthobacteraceae bacterium]
MYDLHLFFRAMHENACYANLFQHGANFRRIGATGLLCMKILSNLRNMKCNVISSFTAEKLLKTSRCAISLSASVFVPSHVIPTWRECGDSSHGRAACSPQCLSGYQTDSYNLQSVAALLDWFVDCFLPTMRKIVRRERKEPGSVGAGLFVMRPIFVMRPRRRIYLPALNVVDENQSA